VAVTIKDVAALAKVSVGTVSRVINARPDVNALMRARVEDAIRELNFRPNARAQNLSRNSSPIISFILSNRSFVHPFHAHVLQGVEEYCSHTGYFVVFARFNYSGNTAVSHLRLPSVLRSHGIADCVIAAGTNYPNFLDAMDGLGMRYVTLANNVIGEAPHPGVNQVRFDDYSGCAEATRYLLQLGHRDIWFLGDISMPWCRVRSEAYRCCMVEVGLEPRMLSAGLADDQFMDGMSSVSLILEKKFPVTAILTSSDDMAYGAWEALQRRNLHVPGDVSLIGFDDQYGAMRYPQLTSVHVQTCEIGVELAKMAIDKIRTNQTGMAEIVVPTKLERRGTCRPLFDTAV
jgi:DNA-binding LacI/PurR family transcriptional regulator